MSKLTIGQIDTFFSFLMVFLTLGLFIGHMNYLVSLDNYHFDN